MTEDKRGDIENPNPGPQATTGPSSNPSDGASGKNDPNKKRKVVALSAFLLVAVVLAIVLGVTLPSDGNDTSSQNFSADKGAIATTAPTTTSSPTTAGPITNPTTAEETPDDGTTLPTDAPPEGEGEAPQGGNSTKAKEGENNGLKREEDPCQAIGRKLPIALERDESSKKVINFLEVLDDLLKQNNTLSECFSTVREWYSEDYHLKMLLMDNDDRATLESHFDLLVMREARAGFIAFVETLNNVHHVLSEELSYSFANAFGYQNGGVVEKIIVNSKVKGWMKEAISSIKQYDSAIDEKMEESQGLFKIGQRD